MSRLLPKRATLLTVATVALLSGAPLLAETGYQQMLQNVTNELSALNVPTTEVGLLSVDGLSQLAAILDSSRNDAAKKSAAEALFRDRLHASTPGMGSEGAVQMQAQLASQLAAAGLTHPPIDQLTFSQVQQLLQIFESPESGDRDEASALLAKIAMPARQAMGNEGAQQLYNEVTVHLDSVGLKVPAGSSLTFQQVADLAAVWDQDGSDSDHAAAAKLILGIN